MTVSPGNDQLTRRPGPLIWRRSQVWYDRPNVPTLLITDNMSVWRFHERFVQVGVNLLDPWDANDSTLGSALQHIDPSLIAVALLDTGCHTQTILAHMKANGLLGACLFHIGKGRWLRGNHPELLAGISGRAGSPFDPLGDLAAMIAFARLMQILKVPNYLCVDVADILACLGASRHDRMIAIATLRLFAIPKQVANFLRRWMREQGVASAWNCVLCVEASHDKMMPLIRSCCEAVLRELGEDAFFVVGTAARVSTTARCTMALLSNGRDGVDARSV